ncbi:MAG: tetratricopeptide repeat protein [Bacteroidetes bacterium]|nr:tetratricopeptide repeat protein [Bacteroidota bacterium]
MDSLENTLQTAIPDSTKLQSIIQLQKYYSYDNKNKAIQLGFKGLLLADKLNDKKNKAWVLNYLGSTYYYNGMNDSAYAYHKQALDIRLTIDDKKGLGASYNNLGNIYDDQGKSALALNYYLKALNYFEEIDFKNGIGIVYNSLGNLYYTQKKIDLSLYYYQKSLENQLKLNNTLGIIHAYNNIAIMYDEKKELKKALEYYTKALTLAEKTNNIGDQITCLNNIGQLYITQKEYVKAGNVLRLSLKLNEEENDTVKMVSPLINMGYLYKEQKRYDSAVVFYEKGLRCAATAGLKGSLKDSYSHLAIVHALKKDFEKAYEYELMYDNIKDTLFNEEGNKQLQELQTKYDTDKKEQTIALLEKEKTIEANIRNSIIGISVLGFILFLVLLFAFRNKKKANVLLANQKVEILNKNKDLQSKNNLIEHQKKEITDSIEYAKTIQNAMLPSDSEVHEVFPQSFVLFKPKDIVSGDFYWFKRINGLHYAAAVDCTGHGVPGAFMSMIGNDKLNFAVQEKKCLMPSEILSELNKGVKEALKQNDSDSKSRDGMDIALCAVDFVKKKLYYAGANRVLYKISNGQLFGYAPTKSAIGGFTPEDFDYKNNEVEYASGDIFYLFTDGYADQFGGATGKKLMTKNFKQLLLSVSKEPMLVQKETIGKAFDEWKGTFEQIDDVLVIGVKV